MKLHSVLRWGTKGTFVKVISIDTYGSGYRVAICDSSGNLRNPSSKGVYVTKSDCEDITGVGSCPHMRAGTTSSGRLVAQGNESMVLAFQYCPDCGTKL